MSPPASSLTLSDVDMVRRKITTYVILVSECQMQILARRATCIATDPEMEELASGFNMTDADVEFAVAQAKEMTEQHAILESIQDEAEAMVNREVIRQ
ncbi:hypothetical protein D1007_34971 [Hordeum vulgare]|nr:hypothetical protein D1007_34971 [Hordeum vulgare]